MMYSFHVFTNEELIRLVKDEGVDLAAWDLVSGKTILHHAVHRGHAQLAEMLLERGADVNAADKGGVTPLLAAVGGSNESAQLLPLLLKHGADVFAKDRLGENALHWLPINSAEDCTAELMARTLIEMGVPLHQRSIKFGHQPIHLAVYWEKIDLVKLYLDHGAKVNAKTKSGESPLHLAAERKDQTTMLETLLERGANVHLRTNTGHTALHKACESLEEENIRILLAAGADVLAEDRNGNTPLAFFKLGSNMESPSFKPMIRALVLRRATSLVPSRDELMKHEMKISRSAALWSYYEECCVCIMRMRFTRFTKSCTFFELLVKKSCHIAKLMRNPDVEANFGLYDLQSGFSMYAEDLRRAFERAQACYRSMLEQEDAINEALYYVLPDLVVRRVVDYIFTCCCS